MKISLFTILPCLLVWLCIYWHQDFWYWLQREKKLISFCKVVTCCFPLQHDALACQLVWQSGNLFYTFSSYLENFAHYLINWKCFLSSCPIPGCDLGKRKKTTKQNKQEKKVSYICLFQELSLLKKIKIYP